MKIVKSVSFINSNQLLLYNNNNPFPDFSSTPLADSWPPHGPPSAEASSFEEAEAVVEGVADTLRRGWPRWAGLPGSLELLPNVA
jgi:hypothetical protein